MRIPDTEKLNMGYSRGIVLGYNCESRKNPDICESLQVRLIDIDIQPEIEVFAPLPKGKIMGLSRASKSENPIGKEVHVCYKYNVGYQEYVYGNLISEDEVENVKKMAQAHKAQDIQNENDRLQRAKEQREYASNIKRYPITKSLIISKNGCLRQIIAGAIFGGIPLFMMIVMLRAFIFALMAQAGDEDFAGMLVFAIFLIAFFLIFIGCGLHIVLEAVRKIKIINSGRYSVVLDTVTSLNDVERVNRGSDSKTYVYKFAFDDYTRRTGRTVVFGSYESKRIQPGDQYYLVIKDEEFIKKEKDNGVLAALPAVKYCYE